MEFIGLKKKGIKMKPQLKVYYMHNNEEDWGVSYFADTYKEARKLFWNEWHSELEAYTNIRGHRIKEIKDIPAIFQKKGEVPLLVGYLIGAYSLYSDLVECPICKTASVEIDSETEVLHCQKCNQNITLEDLIKIEELKQLKGL